MNGTFDTSAANAHAVMLRMIVEVAIGNMDCGGIGIPRVEANTRGGG
jgi:hypothetical protein